MGALGDDKIIRLVVSGMSSHDIYTAHALVRRCCLLSDRRCCLLSAAGQKPGFRIDDPHRPNVQLNIEVFNCLQYSEHKRELMLQ